MIWNFCVRIYLWGWYIRDGCIHYYRGPGSFMDCAACIRADAGHQLDCRIGNQYLSSYHPDSRTNAIICSQNYFDLRFNDYFWAVDVAYHVILL